MSGAEASSSGSTVRLESKENCSLEESEVQVLLERKPEKILRKRITKKFKYLVKWEGHPEVENTWEVKEDLSSDMVAEFEKKLNAQNMAKVEQPGPAALAGVPNLNEKTLTQTDGNGQKRDGTSSSENKAVTTVAIPGKSADSAEILTGFDQGLQPQQIYGAIDSSGELRFLVKWKETDDWGLVPARVANVMCPQGVIAYYEGRMTFGFNRGLKPEKIIGIRNVDGELFLLMKWEGSDEPEYVAALEAKLKCPQEVIAYYEGIVKFKD